MKTKMSPKIKSNIFNAFGLSSLLLVSFYFYEFAYFSVPSFKTIVIELLKIFIFLNFLILIFLRFNYSKYSNFFLFIILFYISVFLIKLLFNASGSLTLHTFLENIYKFIFNYDVAHKPKYIIILSYVTPFIFIFSLLILFRNHLKKVKKFYSIFGIVLLFLMFSDLSKIYISQYHNFDKSVEQLPVGKKEKKILWILYDALDPEFIDTKVNGKKVFKNLNNLRKTGVYHSNMFPPASFTINSVPAQLMGTNIIDSFSRYRTLIFKDLKGKEAPFIFENTIFGTLYNLGAKSSLISTVLEYCSNYLVTSKWKNCDDLMSENLNLEISSHALKFYLGLIFKSKEMLIKLGFIEEVKNEENLKIIENSNLTELKFKDLDFKQLDQITFDKNNFYADHYNLININKTIKYFNESEFVFLHVYNPHLFPKSENIILKNYNIKNYSGNDYLLKYLYVDHFTKNIVNNLKKNSEDILLIISSDHWHRTKENAKNNYVGNAFFLAKILSDDDNYESSKPSNSIIIPGLIEGFYKDDIKSNKDIKNYILNSNVLINTKVDR